MTRGHPHLSRRTFVAGALAATLAAGSASAQAVDMEALTAAAKKEGTLTIYGVPTEQNIKQVAEAFRAAYGIGIEFTRLTNNPMRQRVEAELKAGRPEVDVFVGNDKSLITSLGGNRQLIKLDDLPAAKGYPTEYWDSYGPGLRATLSTLMYNSKLVQSAAIPKTWNDLLDPRWKGRIGLTTPEAGPAAIAVYALVRDRLGDKYFEALGKQQPQLVGTTAAGASLLTSGEILVLAPSYNYIVQPLKDSGAPIDGVLLDLTIRNVDLIAAVEKARHRNAALLFVNWSMSPDGQKAWAGNQVAGSALPNIPTTLAIPDSAVIPDQDHVTKSVEAIRSLFSRHLGL